MTIEIEEGELDAILCALLDVTETWKQARYKNQHNLVELIPGMIDKLRLLLGGLESSKNKTIAIVLTGETNERSF